MRKISLILLVLISLMSLSSCHQFYYTYYVASGMPMSKYDIITTQQNNLTYNSTKYISCPEFDSYFSIDKSNSSQDVLLSWSVAGDLRLISYYSNNETDPLFIYFARFTYLREDYDYLNDKFCPQGISADFNLAEFLPSIFKVDGIDFDQIAEITFYSEKDPRIFLYITIYEENGIFYASCGKLRNNLVALSGEQIKYFQQIGIIN